MTDKQKLALRFSDEILELIDQADDIPRGDLQGCAEGLAMKLVVETRNELIKEATNKYRDHRHKKSLFDILENLYEQPNDAA